MCSVGVVRAVAKPGATPTAPATDERYRSQVSVGFGRNVPSVSGSNPGCCVGCVGIEVEGATGRGPVCWWENSSVNVWR
jgi:hypothetical protein